VKAFLLAAGIGSRLKPLTDTIPKCMLPVGGLPMLDIWLDAFAQAGVDEVLINLHYLADIVRDHVTAQARPLRVRMSYEPELLGSAGTLLANRDWVADEEFFLACNADNLTDFNVADLIKAHREHGPLATIAVFHSPNPSAGGVIDADAEGTVTAFNEKPANPRSDLVNAGIYAFSPSVLDELEGEPPLDIGYKLLPRVVGRARVVPVDGYFRDIGTPEAYRAAQQEWTSR
jgi:mannose-1-phosphate guanylyltransferase